MLLKAMPIAADLRASWEAAVNAPELTESELQSLVDAFRRSGPVPARDAVDDAKLADALWASVLTARVAFVVPGAGLAVYDRLSEDYLDGVPLCFTTRALGEDASARLREHASMAPGLPAALWPLIEGGVDPGQITPAVAALGAAHPVALRDSCARAMRQHPGFDEFRTRAPLPRLTLQRIAGCAAGSLGHALYRLIVDNGFDLEVLDPEVVKDYHPELDGPNRYILQVHEIWHLVAGYSTSPGHEVAISGFQLAQFGHPYSRDFLAAIIALTTFTAPVAACFVIQLALEGWRHGRRTPPLTLVDWDRCWEDSIDDIRARESIEPYRSLLPDLPAPPVAVRDAQAAPPQ
jgi:ubiquinone biosynthesis protein Coq4